jgi:hypothetical protein
MLNDQKNHLRFIHKNHTLWDHSCFEDGIGLSNVSTLISEYKKVMKHLKSLGITLQKIQQQNQVMMKFIKVMKTTSPNNHQRSSITTPKPTQTDTITPQNHHQKKMMMYLQDFRSDELNNK